MTVVIGGLPYEEYVLRFGEQQAKQVLQRLYGTTDIKIAEEISKQRQKKIVEEAHGTLVGVKKDSESFVARVRQGKVEPIGDNKLTKEEKEMILQLKENIGEKGELVSVTLSQQQTSRGITLHAQASYVPQIPEGKVVFVQSEGGVKAYIVGEDYKIYDLPKEIQEQIISFASEKGLTNIRIEGGKIAGEIIKREEPATIKTQEVLKEYEFEKLSPESYRYYLPLTEKQVDIKRELTRASLEAFRKEKIYLVEFGDILTRGVFEELISKEGFLGFYYDIQKGKQYAVYEKEVQIKIPQITQKDVEIAITKQMYDTMDEARKNVVRVNILFEPRGFEYIASHILGKKEIAEEIEREKFVEMIKTNRLEYTARQVIGSLSSPIGLPATSFGTGAIIGKIALSPLFGGRGFLLIMSGIGAVSSARTTYKIYQYIKGGKNIEALALGIASAEALSFGYLGFKSAIKTYTTKTESEFKVEPYKPEGEKQIEIKIDTRPIHEGNVKYTVLEHPSHEKAFLIREEFFKQRFMDLGIKRGFAVKRQTILLFEKQGNEWVLKSVFDVGGKLHFKGREYGYAIKIEALKRDSNLYTELLKTQDSSSAATSFSPTPIKTESIKPQTTEPRIVSVSDILGTQKDYSGGAITKQGQILIQKPKLETKELVQEKLVTPIVRKQTQKLKILPALKVETKTEEKVETKTLLAQPVLVKLSLEQKLEQNILLKQNLRQDIILKRELVTRRDVPLKLKVTQNLDIPQKTEEITKEIPLKTIETIEPRRPEIPTPRISLSLPSEKTKGKSEVSTRKLFSIKEIYKPSIYSHHFKVTDLKMDKFGITFFRPMKVNV